VPETRASQRQALDELAKHNEQVKKHAASVLSRVADAAKQAGVPCDTTQVKNAQPYQAIIGVASDKGCDLIVMASHGRGGLSAVVLGSVTNKVLTHTKIPVLVYRWMCGRAKWEFDELKETTMAMSILLLLLIAAFVAIVFWLFGRNRKGRFAKDARIPLDDDSRNPANRE